MDSKSEKTKIGTEALSGQERSKRGRKTFPSNRKVYVTRVQVIHKRYRGMFPDLSYGPLRLLERVVCPTETRNNQMKDEVYTMNVSRIDLGSESL
jgi:hypothetical protein